MPSKLEQMQLQFRQKLMQEKEERMIKIHTDNQQKALNKVSKYNGAYSIQTPMTVSKPSGAVSVPQPHHSPVKKGSPGVDRSRPLPPISKEQRSYPSSRTSPVSPSIENGAKTSLSGTRSKSVDLESRQSPPRVTQNGRVQHKNGYARPNETEVKQHTFQQSQPEKKPDQDLLAKLKQAELQRLRANTKAREEPSQRAGYSNPVPKSSSEQRKPSFTSKPQVTATPRAKPKPQPAATSTFRKPAAAPSRNAQGASAVAPKPPGPGQEQCRICKRNFNQDRIEKHRSICTKTAQKKVKVFDATKMRVQGTEAEQFIRKGTPKTPPKAKNSNWRKQHSEFINAIRQAKMVQQHIAAGGKVSDLPPPPPSDTSHYVPCPHCGRKFNSGVAERHIPKCKDILCNKKPPPQRRK